MSNIKKLQKLAKTATLTIRLSQEIKDKITEILAKYGMNPSQAVNMFLHHIVNQGGIKIDWDPKDAELELVSKEQIAKMIK